MAFEEKRACIWHAFNSLDDKKKGCVLKSQLKVLTHNIANCVGIQKAEESLEKFRSSQTITFADYIYFLKLEVFSQLSQNDKRNAKVDFSKIDEICWFLCCQKYKAQRKVVLTDLDTYKIWRVFNFLADTDEDGCIKHPVVVDFEEVELMVSRFFAAAGMMHDATMFQDIHAAVKSYDFVHFLNLIETHCCSQLDTDLISLAVEEVFDEYVKNVIKKGFLLKKPPGHIRTGWKERWFVLTHEKLSYYTNKDLKEKKGEVFVTPDCRSEVPPITDKPGSKPYCLHFVTSLRTYEFSCPDLRSRNEWINALKVAVRHCDETTSLQHQSWMKRKASRMKRRNREQEEEETRKKENELMEKTKQALEEERLKSLTTQKQLDAEKQRREAAEAQAEQESTLKELERKRREELESLQKELECLLEQERQAKHDEEIVRNLQARILEEEFQKREHLERLQAQQEEALREERRKREELEALHEEQEELLREERRRLEDLAAAKMNADEQKQQLEALKARQEEMLAEERRRREELEYLRRQQEEILEEERNHLEKLQEDKQAANEKLQVFTFIQDL